MKHHLCWHNEFHSFVCGMMMFCLHTSEVSCYWIPRTMWLSGVHWWSQSNRGFINAVMQFHLWEKGGTVPPKDSFYLLLFLCYFICFSLMFFFLLYSTLCLTKPPFDCSRCVFFFFLFFFCFNFSEHENTPLPPERDWIDHPPTLTGGGTEAGSQTRKWLGGRAGRGSLAFLFLL